MAPSSDVAEFQKALSEAKNIIILSGAGLSAPSEDPSGSWQFYSHRRKLALDAKPNAGHLAIASLNLPEIASRVIPSASLPPLHVTQNLDELALRAIKQVVPSDNAELTEEALGRHEKHSYEPFLSAALKDLPPDSLEKGTVVPVDKLPKCGGDEWNGSNRYGRCGGLLRPDVVWFGEVPPLMGEIARKITWCDLLIVVGTSSVVQPAAGFASQVKGHGGKVAFFNVERTEKDADADFVFVGSCDETLLKALGVEDVVSTLLK
ncbi:hypothetical protein NMY22_g4560 [Coprinellus aureogranulatus]|nr:hypothetical protein NMY22_g4560 [Coprinellus aureogranulatus]